MIPSIAPSRPIRLRSSVLVPINVLAARLGLSHRALRHYEALGLVHSERDFGNTRHYDSQAVATLEVIAFLRRADIAIPVIRSIIALRHDRPRYLQAIREALIDAAEHKERDLAALREALVDLESASAAFQPQEEAGNDPSQRLCGTDDQVGPSDVRPS
ncbi:MAG: hypothetical protein B7Z44_18920 [Caulobacter sp. 12-67-6]|nr:MAG: hypothetical protein B7Z44_18920 [Caulobacter sp. 12-67-6]OYX74174.1 MAG: hypothetical protein B7Y81_00135 [Caulobacter sp. 32-67-35]OZA77890.1 MAG: hypothetical protein B7X77_04110 [Caulobacter sp. 39-67-4]HQR87747.1 MerR family transcriptional regulator [Caulobacter sp.]